MSELWSKFSERPEVLALAIIAGSIILAQISSVLTSRILLGLTRRSATTLDDIIVAGLRRPVFVTVVLIGLIWAAELVVPESGLGLVTSILESMIIFAWLSSGNSVTSRLLRELGERSAGGMLQARTLPVFIISAKVLLAAAAAYFMFLAWNIDVTAWLASAGIVGLAMGFAAKDSLSNLFSGLSLLADAAYSVGDFIVLDDKIRGRVIAIGLRSTRVLTQDHVEVTVPNSVIAGARIVNETGGPDRWQRVSTGVSVAYDSDIDKVRELLLSVPIGLQGVRAEPAPQVRLKAFGESGLEFVLQAWIDDAAAKDTVIDRINTKIFKTFKNADVVIPFPRREVWMHQAEP